MIVRLLLDSWRARRLTVTLTLIAIALGSMLTIALLLVESSTRSAYNRTAEAADLVVGPKSSALSSVLTYLYFLEQPTGTIPYAPLEQLRTDSRVAAIAPLAMGDTYRGYRLIATTEAFFDHFGPGRKPWQLQAGQPFTVSEEALQEAFAEAAHNASEESEEHHHDHEEHAHSANIPAVFGSLAARGAGIKLGDTFHASHGLAEAGEEHHDATWEVTGILQPSGTPADRAIFIPLDSFYRIEGHDLRTTTAESFAALQNDHEATEPTAGRVSGALLQLRNPIALLTLQRELSLDPELSASLPVFEVQRLLEMLGEAQSLLLGITLLVIVVSLLGVVVALISSLDQRRRDLAILRTLGYHRGQLLGLAVGEGLLLGGAGCLLGMLAGHLLAWRIAPLILERANVLLDPWRVGPEHAAVFLAFIGGGLLAGALPAYRAATLPVAETLSAT